MLIKTISNNILLFESNNSYHIIYKSLNHWQESFHKMNYPNANPQNIQMANATHTHFLSEVALTACGF